MRNLVNLLRRHRRIFIPIETLALVFCVFMLLRSSDDNENASDMPELTEISEADQENAGSVEIPAPDKADVMAMKELVLDGMSEEQESVLNEALKNDLQQIIEEAGLAAETHDVEHAEKLYYLLHDMDYFLLNYRLDTEGQYVKDKSTISRYYGVLSVYD